MDEAHEGGDGFLAAQGDAAEALELVEEAFDLMAFLVEAPIDGRFGGSTGIGLDLRGGAKVVGDEGAQRIGVISGIGDDVTDALQASQQRLGLGTIAALAGRRMDADRQPDGIDGRMQFGCQATPRSPDRGSFSPPFAPAASAWTFEMVLSMRTYSKSGVSARL